MIGKLFKENSAYREVVNSYSLLDGMLALALFVLAIGSYCLGLFAYSHIGFSVNILATTIILFAIFVLLCLRKQKLSSLGITKANFHKSLLVGSVLGVFVVFVRMQSGSLIVFSSTDSSVNHLYSIFHFFVLVSLTEEILFRGYIQTRIHGIMKSRFFAIILAGILCAAVHVIIDVVAYSLIDDYMVRNWNLLGLVISHIFFNLLYTRYNSLIGPVILHGFVNIQFFVS